MVINHIERHSQVPGVGHVYELLQIARRTIAVLCCKRKRAVISPVPSSGELRNGHQLDGRNSEIGESVEMRNHRGKSAVSRERANVKFVENALFERGSLPAIVGPWEAARVNHL